jgi:hypothetical protein
MPGLDDLDNLTGKELIKLVKEQGAEIEDLKKEVNRKQTQSTTKERVEGEIRPFALNPMTQMDNLIKGFKEGAGAFYDGINIFNDEIFTQLDEYATSIQSSFGLSKARIGEFRATIAETIPELIKFGMTEQDAIDTMTNAMEGLGTAASLTSETIVELAATNKVTGVSTKELVENFREVGTSIKSVGDEMNSVTDYARSVGVSVKGVSEKVSDNLKQMNLFNFENGVQGLAKMAAQSERLGVSMGDTFVLAEKLMSPEKAIEMSAGLQRLGVTSGALLDPLRAMDLAQNDPEQLQKEMVNLSKEFTTFNEKTGKMEILPGAKRRLREVANELGMMPDEFAKMSIQASDFDRKLKQIRMPSLAEGDEATKELIASMAQLDASGVATIQVKDAETGIISEKKVEELTPDDIKQLQKANEESSKSIEEIAINQLDVTKQINSYLQSGKVATGMALATAPSVEKLGYTLAGTQQSIAQRYSKELGSVKDIREKQQAVGGSIENYIVGFTRDDQEMMDQAKSEFFGGMSTVAKSFFDGMESFVGGVFDDGYQKFSSAYGGNSSAPTEITYKHEGTITVKGEGDAKGSMNLDMSNPDVQTSIKNVIIDKNLPSAATGTKNK